LSLTYGSFHVSCLSCCPLFLSLLFLISSFFFTVTATTDIYTLSLHDALPILHPACRREGTLTHPSPSWFHDLGASASGGVSARRSEEHTSELQSHLNLVCRLLLEKKKKKKKNKHYST